VLKYSLFHFDRKESNMRITKNLWLVILSMVCITISGCDTQKQAATVTKATSADKGPSQMKFNIVERDAFTVMGVVARVTPDQENADTYAGIWKQFESYDTNMKPLSIDRRYYGVSFATDQKGVTDYLAGMMVADDAKPFDKQLVVRKVPAARYAVFQCSAQTIGQTYQYIFSQWLPNSRYEISPAGSGSFEQYPPKDWENRPVFIHIPVSKKGPPSVESGK
jgi:predicted transcriptional regulator YdeE